MRPFFLFYGGKFQMARKLTPPQHEHVIEPFAGSAGYSVFHEARKVTLVEKDPTLFGVWHYLTRVSTCELLKLPTDISSLDELPASIPQEARDLIGFWFNRSTATPSQRRSNWARRDDTRHMFWGEQIRCRIASQLEKIRGWQIIHGDYSKAPDVEAHYHVDPPYRVAGQHYKYSGVDYQALAEWCLSRRGYMQVCENTGAEWLPFQPYAEMSTGRTGRNRPTISREAIFEKGKRIGSFLIDEDEVCQ